APCKNTLMLSNIGGVTSHGTSSVVNDPAPLYWGLLPLQTEATANSYSVAGSKPASSYGFVSTLLPIVQSMSPTFLHRTLNVETPWVADQLSEALLYVMFWAIRPVGGGQFWPLTYTV